MNNSNVPTGNGNRKLNIRMSEDVGTKIKEWNGGDEISLHTTVVNISERKILDVIYGNDYDLTTGEITIAKSSKNANREDR